MTTFDDLPVPEKANLMKCQALCTEIQQAIEQAAGYLPFATFMDMALYHPAHGYYTSAIPSIGARGDFTTAPEISPLFAHCFAGQVKQLLGEADLKAVMEIGAGTGRFALDLLNKLHTADSLPEHYFIVETSPLLRQRQQQLLAASGASWYARVVWLDAVPSTFQGVILANEVLDALPVHLMQWDQGEPQERYVGWDQQQFVWRLAPPSSEELLREALSLQEHYGLNHGYRAEIPLASSHFIRSLAQSLTRGFILLADYGYGQREYYHPQRQEGTLTCFYQHHQHANPFVYPGLQDITSHVDFTRVIETAAEHGCSLAGYTTQSAFLLAAGLLTLASATEEGLTEQERFKLHQAIKLLTLPTEMGERVKIMGLSKDCDVFPSAFATSDRGRDL